MIKQALHSGLPKCAHLALFLAALVICVVLGRRSRRIRIVERKKEL